MSRNFRFQLRRQRPVVGEMAAARLGCDREAWRHGELERCHLGEAKALAAEELAPTLAVFIEVEDELVDHGAHLPVSSLQSASTCA